MIYALLVFCIISAIFSYPLIYNVLIFSKEMEKFHSHLRAERADLALKILKNLPEKKQQSLEVHLAFSEAHIMKKHWYLALFHLSEIIEKKLYTNKNNSPTSKINIHLKKAAIYNSINKTKNAINEYFHILKIDPKHLVANTEIGTKLFDMKNYSSALLHLQQAQLHSPKDPKIAETLSDTYVVMEAYHEALRHIQQAIQHSDPVHCRLRHKEVLSLFHLKRYPEALSIATSIEHTYAKSSEIEIIMGIIHCRLDHLKEAEELFSDNLAHYLNNYSPIILEARYLYSDILLQQCNFISAVVQLSFIQKAHETYLDTDERLATFREIINNDILNDFFKSLAKGTETAPLLTDILSDDKNFLLYSSFERLPASDIFVAKAEMISSHEKILLVFDICLKGLSDDLVTVFANLQQEEQSTTGIPIKKLYYFSLLTPDSLLLRKLKEHFLKSFLVNKEQLFETIINRKIFIFQEEYA